MECMKMNVKNMKDSVMGRIFRKKVVDSSLSAKSPRDPDMVQSAAQKQELETNKNRAIAYYNRLWSL